ncbi:hypothetical protein C8Q80DRAFT_467168 [Daedaleopsis nitida]|nr:hypothetical protein C8Q80DRAFT_467168 [Daedaleopsis nitida]
MSLVNRSLAKLLSIFLPWQDPLPTPPSRRIKRHRSHSGESDEPSDPTQNVIGRRRPTLETINADVLRLITLELKGKAALCQLSACSRALRVLVAPVLFYSCRVSNVKDPPDFVRSFARELTIESNSEHDIPPGFFKRLLEDLRSLTGITFNVSHHIHLTILELCLKCPRIRSLSFGPETDFTLMQPYAEQLSAISTQLSAFSCERSFWLEVDIRPRHSRRYKPPRDLRTVFPGEAACLSALLPTMSDTVSRLSCPMQTSPILAMAELSWPRLRHLAIDGRYLSQAQADSLPVLLSSLTQLATLSVQIRREKDIGRAPTLGIRDPPSTSLSGLRSLTIAYPDPNDDIFLIDTSLLTHLSLRDCPRYYHELCRTSSMVGHWWASPLPLSAAETMHILRRMDMPLLSRLELVYIADTICADDELLSYVASTYTEISELELHRYRVDREEEVEYAHIVRLLTPMRALRSVRLNLDFHDDHGAYCDDHEDRDAWFEIFKNQRGPEIVDILQDCPYLEYVALLYHGYSSATWAEFHPLRCAEPRFVLEYDDMHEDSEPIPIPWYTPRYTRRRRSPLPQSQHDAQPGPSS